jgi:peptidase M23-like protein
MGTTKKQIPIDFPLRGEWQFLRPPGHHPFAFDFVQKDAARKSYHPKGPLREFIGSVPSEEFYCWNKPVYAPADGEVVQMGDNWDDHIKVNIWRSAQIWYQATYRFKPKVEQGKLDIRPNAGNHLMIKSPKNFIIFLAHLKNNSIKVKVGDWVKAGDLLGNVGNSGNSTMPHLHINLFDQMDDPFTAQVLPFVFSRYQQLEKLNGWESREHAIPDVKSFIKIG